MKKIFLLTISSFLLISCTSKKEKIKKIIDNSYFGIYGLKEMKEIDKLREDIYSLPVHYTIVQKYNNNIEKGDKYEITRYIYKTYEGVYRIYYLIDLTDKEIVNKSSDFKEFYAPIASDILGNNMDIEMLKGDNLMQLMRY